MIKKIVSYIGKVFAVWLVISVILLLPILIRELLSLRKKNKD